MNTILEQIPRDVFDDIDKYISEDILLEHAVVTWNVVCQKSGISTKECNNIFFITEHFVSICLETV